MSVDALVDYASAAYGVVILLAGVNYAVYARKSYVPPHVALSDTPLNVRGGSPKEDVEMIETK
jgi:hypothetical protein